MKIQEIPMSGNQTPKVMVVIKPKGDPSTDVWQEVFTLRVAIRSGPDIYIAKPLEFEKRDDMAAYVEEPPVLMVPQVQGSANAGLSQAIMDQLWQAGVRPTDIGTPGHLAATQAHLADFRAIVEKTLEVKLPGAK